MRAIVVDRWMDPSELTVREAPDPQLTPRGVLIEVRAAGCNFFDTLIVQGKYQVKPQLPFTPGGELAGVVRAVGEDVTGIRVGDRVLASGNTGGFAELAVADARSVHVLPDRCRSTRARRCR
jgi:NADPH2:quinone reductase